MEALAGEHVVSASGGNFHSLAVSVSGEVFTFGFGEDGLFAYTREHVRAHTQACVCLAVAMCKHAHH